jgi:hypothetical protein
MVFAIAVVPKDADIPLPESASKLADLGVIGSGTATTTTVAGDAGTTTTVAGSTTTVDTATSTTGG